MYFKINILSKSQEDCFFIEVGNDDYNYNILVDGNKKMNDEMNEFLKGVLKIDFLVITHIDNDHIGGVINLYNSIMKDKIENALIIYNKFTSGEITYDQAEEIEKILQGKTIINTYSSYQKSRPNFSVLSFEQRKLLQKNCNNVYLTLLHPKKNGVKSVYIDYKKYKNNKKKPNSKLINKNSIVFLLEVEDRCALFTGDAYIEDIKKQIEELSNEDSINSPIKKIDLIKIPHHGSKDNNLDLLELAKKSKCKIFINTSNADWDKKHPDKELVDNLCSEIEGIKIYTETILIESSNENFDKTKLIEL